MVTIDLTGKHALVTGGTRGIGRAISRRLAEAGASTTALYYADAGSADESLRERIGACPGQHQNVRCDVGDPHQIEALPEQLRGFGQERVDLLIHNAAVQGRGAVSEFPVDQWRRMLDVNLSAAFFLARAMLPAMPSGSSIVNIASGAGHDPMAGLAAYGASKAGLVMFTADLAQDIGPKGIRANVVSPGGTDTSPHPQPKSVEHNALRRQGVAQDVADVVLFLCCDLARFVTGQTIRVNGGAF